ncbi:MAG: hypothetical protein QOH00_3168, partial [Gaiellales bacterium]|nr:hypothetical protein [Gaiellales bacterium]
MNKLNRTILLAALLCATALIPAAPAAASPTQPTLLQDDPELLYGSSALRAKRLNEFKSLGVDVVKVRVRWRDLAPKKRPADGSNPDIYGWGPYDEIVSGAESRGLTVFFQLGGTAPDWATPGKSPVANPNAGEFGKFVKATGAHFPNVHLWSIWNEPNLKSWLSPQVSGGVPQSPRIYRGLINAASSGLSASGHGSDQILIGELLPFTRTSRNVSTKLHPLQFLRELACVDSHYRAFKGKAATRRGCKGFKSLPGTGLAYHPYTLAGGPGVRTPNKDDATISDLGRVTRVLSKLRSRHKIRSSWPIWISEFGFQSNPPDRYASPIKKIPGFMGRSEYIAYKNRRVASFSQYPLIDDAGKVDGFQSGIRFHNNKKKPGVFAAFQRPFYARMSGSRVELFGAVRAAEGGAVTLQTRTSKKAKWKSLGNATLNSRGYFDKRVKVSGASKRYFRFIAS